MKKNAPQLTSGFNKTIRIPDEMMNALEKKRSAMEQKFPGHSVTVSDIIREAISRYLGFVGAI